MKWHDMHWGALDDPGGVLEVDEAATSLGLAIQLHVFAHPEGTFAVWLLESGEALYEPTVGIA